MYWELDSFNFTQISIIYNQNKPNCKALNRVRTGPGKPGKSWNFNIPKSRPGNPGKSWKIEILHNLNKGFYLFQLTSHNSNELLLYNGFLK